MSVFRRIASLHRELAEAYEQLAAEQAPKVRRPSPRVELTGPAPSQETVDRVRRKLRRDGVAA